MLSHPLTISQSEDKGQDKPDMAPPSELPFTGGPAPLLPLAKNSAPVLPLGEDSAPEFPLAEAAMQTASMTPQMSPPSPPASFPQMSPGPCVHCSSVLPRLLSSLLSLHQKEMKRLIGGTMATIDQRLSALERCFSEDRGPGACPSSEGAEPVTGPSHSGKRRRSREEKETRRKRRKHSHRDENDRVGQSEKSVMSEDQSEKSIMSEDQSEKSVCAVFGQNGLRPLLCSQFSSVSHDDLGLSLGKWRFSDSAPRTSNCRGDLRVSTMSWMMMRTLPGHDPLQLPWRLSVVAVKTAVGLITAEVSMAPERPLQDHSVPPSVGTDHSYVRLSAQSLVISVRRQQRLSANHCAHRRPLPLLPVPTNGLTASLSTAQSGANSNLPGNKRDVKRVSQIRIRRASPKETNLTPMGLPKAKRLRKKEFSLEEIYTNKNYKSPPANSSSLETIFEEPREKDGAVLLIGQQRRRRVLQFPDFTQPRKRKRAPTGVGLVIIAPRKRAAARRSCHGDDDCDSDVMLLQRLSALHDFLQHQGLDQDS